jgi:hypothetical protein
MVKECLQLLTDQTVGLADAVSALTGYAAVRVPLERARRRGEVTLDLVGYRQIDSYSCGAVAAAMIARAMRPGLRFQQVHAAVSPSPVTGASVTRVTRALRSLGVGVSPKNRLTFAGVCAAIDAGCPLCVHVGRGAVTHWVVIYGYGRRPELVFVAGQGLPFLARQRVPWRQFRSQWHPPRPALLCYDPRPPLFRAPR